MREKLERTGNKGIVAKKPTQEGSGGAVAGEEGAGYASQGVSRNELYGRLKAVK